MANPKRKNIRKPAPAPVQGKTIASRGLGNFITPVQLQRISHDIGMWRDAIREAEFAYFPYRVKQQRMYLDTELNGHVYAVWERRKDLTLLRDHQVVDLGGNISEELTQSFQPEYNEWFSNFLSYAIDALAYGYNLVKLGDIVNSQIEDVTVVKRWNISPDRLNVGSNIYMPSGIQFLEDPKIKDWHVWVPTPSTSGISNCGFGLFYQIALYEIVLRNVLGDNASFTELYSQPYRVGKTTKTNEDERAELERALQMMGSSGYAVLDPTDEIEFLEANLAGTGWKGYENLETRCEKKISKVLLGHADAVDSIPGKLGSGQNPDDPVITALRDKQTKDGRFVSAIVNKVLIPKMQTLGIFPQGYRWEFKNDKELMDIRVQEDKNNLATSQIAQTMKNAGLQMDAKYFMDRTGIPTEKIEVPAPMDPNADPKQGGKPNKFNNRIKSKLDRLYHKH